MTIGWKQNLANVDQHLATMAFDEIKQKVAHCLGDFASPLYFMPKGTYVYRARADDQEFFTQTANLHDLLPPQPEKAPVGRLNQKGTPLFYGALACEAALFEQANLKQGDIVTLSVWNVIRDVPVQHMGYTHTVLEKRYPHIAIPSQSQAPSWSILPARTVFSKKHLRPTDKKHLFAADTVDDVSAAIHDMFTREVTADESYKYHMSIALAQLLHEKNKRLGQACEGTIYPSAQSWPTGDNIAMLPDCMSNFLRFETAYHVEIEHMDAQSIGIKIMDRADRYDANGRLEWHEQDVRNEDLQDMPDLSFA